MYFISYIEVQQNLSNTKEIYVEIYVKKFNHKFK